MNELALFAGAGGGMSWNTITVDNTIGLGQPIESLGAAELRRMHHGQVSAWLWRRNGLWLARCSHAVSPSASAADAGRGHSTPSEALTGCLEVLHDYIIEAGHQGAAMDVQRALERCEEVAS